MKERITARRLTTSLVPHGLLRWSRRAVDHLTFPPDFSPEQIALFQQVEPYTMTSPERIIGLYDAVTYVLDNNIVGDVVECGVWRGGSMMTAALALLARKQTRNMHLFDTYEGMPPPSAKDVAWTGHSAKEILNSTDKKTGRNVWCIADQADVQRNLAQTGYDLSHVRFVKGRVQDTLPEHAPAHIALLRLDTDWYESTQHELTHLYPRLVSGGVLILDDYGHWQGAKKAVDEYFENLRPRPLLSRVDNSGRIAIKP